MVTKDADTILTDPDAGQPVGGEGARIDVNSIFSQIRLPHRRMPMDDNVTKISSVIEEVPADIE